MVSVMLHHCMFCAALFVLYVACLTVCGLFGETIRNMFGRGC